MSETEEKIIEEQNKETVWEIPRIETFWSKERVLNKEEEFEIVEIYKKNGNYGEEIRLCLKDSNDQEGSFKMSKTLLRDILLRCGTSSSSYEGKKIKLIGKDFDEDGKVGISLHLI